MHVLTLPLGAYQTNCYLVWGENTDHCLVIDPGYDPELVLAAAQRAGKTVEAILLTHGHFDHVGGVEALMDATGCPVWMCREDWIAPIHPMGKALFPLAGCDRQDIRFFREGSVLSLAGGTFQILETPGHTRGSVCIDTGRELFTGDTLFCGSCGRTDLPGGNRSVLQDSLRRLAALKKNYTIYPGHGSASTLEDERGGNPYLNV